MVDKLFEEALGYAKKNVPGYIKIDKTFEDALKYHLNKTKPDEVTEQFVKNWIKTSYK
jgi:hypothetical protein